MQVHLGDTPHNLTESDFEFLGRKTEGFSGSDVAVCVSQLLFLFVIDVKICSVVNVVCFRSHWNLHASFYDLDLM